MIGVRRQRGIFHLSEAKKLLPGTTVQLTAVSNALLNDSFRTAAWLYGDLSSSGHSPACSGEIHPSDQNDPVSTAFFKGAWGRGLTLIVCS